MKKNTLNIFSTEKRPATGMITSQRKWLILPAILLMLLLSNCRKENLKTDTAAIAKNSSKRTEAIPAKSEAVIAMDVYNNTFFQDYGTYGTSRKAYYWHDMLKTTRSHFWVQAETIETLIDAYNVNPTPAYKDKIQYLYNGFLDQNGVLWTSNTYNDDVIWGALMAVRSYEITNDATQLAVAKNNFDLVWDRGWDTTVGGGIWWNTTNMSKNTCVNAPAAICAVRLYEATGDVVYKNRAKLIMDWMVNTLYVPSTGEVKGAINASGVITEGPLSYTQGTFIGAANELRPYYTGIDYLGMGKKAMDYAKSSMCVSPGSYLKDELGNGDTYGIKSIFARWACVFVAETGTVTDYGAWLDLNATQAWSIRNFSGIMWTMWGTRTLDLPIHNCWGTNGGVSMVLNIYRFH